MCSLGKINLDKCIEQLYRCEVLPEVTIKQLCDKLKEILIYESNIQAISSPVTVVGDLHGCAPLPHNTHGHSPARDSYGGSLRRCILPLLCVESVCNL